MNPKLLCDILLVLEIVLFIAALSPIGRLWMAAFVLFTTVAITRAHIKKKHNITKSFLDYFKK